MTDAELYPDALQELALTAILESHGAVWTLRQVADLIDSTGPIAARLAPKLRALADWTAAAKDHAEGRMQRIARATPALAEPQEVGR